MTDRTTVTDNTPGRQGDQTVADVFNDEERNGNADDFSPKGTVPGVFPIIDFYQEGVKTLRRLREDYVRSRRAGCTPSVLNNMDAALGGLNRLNRSLADSLNRRLAKGNEYADDLLLADYLSHRTLKDFQKKEQYLKDLDHLGEKYLRIRDYTAELRDHMKSYADYSAELMALRDNLNTASPDKNVQIIRIEDLTDLCLREFNVADGMRRALTDSVTAAVRKLEQEKEEEIRSFTERALSTQFEELKESVDFCSSQGIPYSVYARSFGGDGSDEEIRDMTVHYMSKFLKNGGRETEMSPYATVRPSDSGSVFLRYINVVRNNVPLIKLLDSLGRTLGLEALASRRSEKIYTERIGRYRKSVKGDHISGITLSDTLNYVLPEELARLSDPELESLFDIKLLNRELLAFDFIKMARVFSGNGRTAGGEGEQERGPVIVCVDTSGSMKGENEDYAKAVTAVLALKCLEAGRPCHIINFAIETETLTITGTEKDTSLDELNSFLKRSFRGGTSIDNALREVSGMIEHNPAFARADLLCITDGKYLFSEETVRDARRIREKYGTRYLEFVKGFSDFNKNGIFDRIFVICNNNFSEK